MFTFLKRMLIVMAMFSGYTCTWIMNSAEKPAVDTRLQAETTHYTIEQGGYDIRIITPQVQWLYVLYPMANKNAETFIGLIRNIDQNVSIDECIALLEENKIYMQKVLIAVDELYYSSRNLSKGLILGGLTLGGIAAGLKGAQWIASLMSMYNKEKESALYAQGALLETIKSLRQGFVTEEEAKEIEETYKEYDMQPSAHKSYKDLLLDVFSKYDTVQTLAMDQAGKALSHAGFKADLSPSSRERAQKGGYAVFGIITGGALYGVSLWNLMHYISDVYQLYQTNKKNRDMVLKVMDENEKMLQVLKSSSVTAQ